MKSSDQRLFETPWVAAHPELESRGYRRNQRRGLGGIQPIPRRKPRSRDDEPLVVDGIPKGRLGNRSFVTAAEARQAAIAEANRLNKTVGLGHSIARSDAHQPGELPHYHVIDPQGKQISGHFFYGRKPYRVEPGLEGNPQRTKADALRDLNAKLQAWEDERQKLRTKLKSGYATRQERGRLRWLDNKLSQASLNAQRIVTEIHAARRSKRQAQRELEALPERSSESQWLFEVSPGRQVVHSSQESTTEALEAAWAFNHPGIISGTGAAAGSEDNEFVFWNYLVGSEKLRRTHLQALTQIALRWRKLLKIRPDLRIKIIGSASQSSGTAEVNQRLAVRRAERVRDFLVRMGISSAQIEVRSVGNRQPLADELSPRNPENMARDRRVELFLYVPTQLVKSLGNSIRARVASFTASFSSKNAELDFNLKTNLFSERLFGIKAAAQVSLSGPPESAIGFLQFLRKDSRIGIYRVKATGRTSQLNYGRCTSPFLPCRDVTDATSIFSIVGPSHSSAPTQGLVEINFADAPGVAFPILVKDPVVGEMTLERSLWAMEFVLILGVRLGNRFMPLRYMVWELRSQRNFISGTPVGNPIVRQISAGLGVPSGLPIESAMSGRTCRLLTRGMDLPIRVGVCRPQVTRT